VADHDRAALLVVAGLVDERPGATDVVGVAVGVDDRVDRLVAAPPAQLAGTTQAERFEAAVEQDEPVARVEGHDVAERLDIATRSAISESSSVTRLTEPSAMPASMYRADISSRSGMGDRA